MSEARAATTTLPRVAAGSTMLRPTVTEEETLEDKRASRKVRTFYDACEKDAELCRTVNIHALVAPLTWGASVIDVEALGLPGLEMLAKQASFALEDCINPRALVIRAIEALDGQELPSEAMCPHPCDTSFARSSYWRALATVVKLWSPINLNIDQLTALQLIPRVKAILQSEAFVKLLTIVIERLRAVSEAHGAYFPGPLPLTKSGNEDSKLCGLCRDYGPLGPNFTLEQLSAYMAKADLANVGEPPPTQRAGFSEVWITFMYLSRALLEIVSPSNKTDRVLKNLRRYDGWVLRSWPLDDCFNMPALRLRARYAVIMLSGGHADAAPLPARAADERGLAGLLAGGEGIAATLVPLISSGSQFAFKVNTHTTSLIAATFNPRPAPDTRWLGLSRAPDGLPPLPLCTVYTRWSCLGSPTADTHIPPRNRRTRHPGAV